MKGSFQAAVAAVKGVVVFLQSFQDHQNGEGY